MKSLLPLRYVEELLLWSSLWGRKWYHLQWDWHFFNKEPSQKFFHTNLESYTVDLLVCLFVCFSCYLYGCLSVIVDILQKPSYLIQVNVTATTTHAHTNTHTQVWPTLFYVTLRFATQHTAQWQARWKLLVWYSHDSRGAGMRGLQTVTVSLPRKRENKWMELLGRCRSWVCNAAKIW